LFAAAFHCNGGCRRVSAFGQLDFHHAQVCLPEAFVFTPNGARSLSPKFLVFKSIVADELNRIVRFDSSKVQFPLCHREAANGGDDVARNRYGQV